MRVEYKYTEYINSKRATEKSNMFKAILTHLEVFLGIPNIGAIVALCYWCIRLIESKNDLTAFFIIIPVVLVDYIIIVVHMLVDYSCERTAIKEEYGLIKETNRILVDASYEGPVIVDRPNKRSVIKEEQQDKEKARNVLESHRKQTMTRIKKFTIKYFVFLPLVLIGICSITAAIYGLFNNIIAFIVGVLVAIVDIAAIISIIKKH